MKNIIFQQPIELFAGGSAVGQMEKEGQIGSFFDYVSEDDKFGAKTWESAESKMVTHSIESALKAADCTAAELDFITGGDLLNQCTASSYGCIQFSTPFLGLYGACSTFSEGLLVASSLLNAGKFQTACVVASSHFSSAERQYRFPLEYGCQRTPTAQRTVTGAGAALLRPGDMHTPDAMLITEARIGVMVDGGVTDANHMGAAMAPAAADTLITYLRENGAQAEDFDLILTGDLGSIGAELFRDLCARDGVLLGAQYLDCGMQIYKADQDVHAGASGCGCSAIYLCGYLKKVWKKRPFHNALFLGTGALLSPTTVQQKETIPGIAHLIRFTRGGN